MMQEVEHIYLGQVREIFASERENSWAPLAQQTQEEREKEHYNPQHPILVRSGRLFENLTTNAVFGQSQPNPGSFTMMIGTDDERFTELQESVPDRRLPSRSMTIDEGSRWYDAFDRFMVEAMDNNVEDLLDG
jgi:hypothetical protein